jgi:hypothetical protein
VIQAVLDDMTLIYIKTTNGNVYNSEDMMSIPTSLTRGTAVAVAEEAELLVAA